VALVESDAMVLRHVRQGDTSHVVTLLARDTGKVAVLAKGSRTPGSRFGAGLDLFSVSHIRYRARPSADLVFLDGCELRKSFADLARDVFAYAAAGVCAELVERLVPEGGSSAEIFDLLLEAWTALVETVPLPPGEELRAVALPVAFQMKLMDVLGIAPELTGCVVCGNEDLGGSTSLSASRGGSCARDAAGRAADVSAPGGGVPARGALRGVVPSDDDAAPRKVVVMESRAALDALLEYHHHGRPGALKSRRFGRALR
jgi:DNA repair protein RecO (recombination protein O)